MPGVGPVPGVGAVIVDARGRLLMVKRGGAAGRGLWSIPGGKVGYGETLRQAARREVREETSLEVEIEDVVWVGEAIGPGDPPDWHYVLVDFRARVISGQPQPGDDADAAEWVPLAEVPSRPVTPTLLELLETLDLQPRS